MTVLLFVEHLIAFIAPAAGVALLLLLGLRVRRATRLGPGTQFAVLLGGGAVVLLAGLLLFGRDGRMFTYAGLVLVQATLAWWLRRV